jgi:hypothetical protein
VSSVHALELPADDHLRVTDDEIAPRPERALQAAGHPDLQRSIERGQHVAAQDQVEPRERCVAHEVVRREDHLVAERLVDAEAGRERVEEPRQAVAVDRGRDVRAEHTVAGAGDRLPVAVGREHLDRPRHTARLERLDEDHRERVRVLTGRAAGAPGTNRLVPRLARQQLGHEHRRDPIKHLGIAEEARSGRARGLVMAVHGEDEL